MFRMNSKRAKKCGSSRQDGVAAFMQELQTNGARLAFLEALPVGEDRQAPILLLHGFASNHAVNWVHPLWVKALTEAARRVIAFDLRGHGRSQKFYDPAAYHMVNMVGDACALLDGLGIARADQGQPSGLAEAMEAPSFAALEDPMLRFFRALAGATKNDLAALTACLRGSRQFLSPLDLVKIDLPALIAVGTMDEIAGNAHQLAAFLPRAEAVVFRDVIIIARSEMESIRTPCSVF